LPKKNWPRMDADENDLASALASLARLVRRRRRPPAPPVLEFKLAGGDGEGGAGGSIDPDYDWRLGAGEGLRQHELDLAAADGVDRHWDTGDRYLQARRIGGDAGIETRHEGGQHIARIGRLSRGLPGDPCDRRRRIRDLHFHAG